MGAVGPVGVLSPAADRAYTSTSAKCMDTALWRTTSSSTYASSWYSTAYTSTDGCSWTGVVLCAADRADRADRAVFSSTVSDESQRQVVRRNHPAATLTTTVADHLLRLVHALNAVPASVLPWTAVLDATREPDLRQDASFDPEAGVGDENEADVGNTAGSALLLAVALPEIYGVHGTPPLRCFGFPLQDKFRFVGTVQHRSGVGADNRRQNEWEAVLKHWQHDAASRWKERDVLMATLVAMRLTVDSVGRGLNWQVDRHTLKADVAMQLGAQARSTHNGHMVV
jgi:hypothetical protein